MSTLLVQGWDRITLQGREGTLVRLYRPCEITGNAEVDLALSSFPVAFFQPPGRDPTSTPLVLALQGMAAPYQWNYFLVPTLLDMGIACALFDTPMAGERSLTRERPGDVLHQLATLRKRGLRLTTSMVLKLSDFTAGDLALLLSLLRDQHGMQDERVALFGVSLGCLLASLAFTRDGLGQRLLGVIGHADLRLFARSYAPPLLAVLASWPARLLGWAVTPLLGPTAGTVMSFLRILNDLCRGRGECAGVNPISHVGRVDASRRARFLVGQEDQLVRPQDAVRCARRFPMGECYVVPGLGHGTTSFGPSFIEHVRTFLGTQLGDWRW